LQLYHLLVIDVPDCIPHRATHIILDSRIIPSNTDV
jgi:hypothetical protein